MSPLFTSINSDKPKQLELSLDLGPYIQAYENQPNDSGHEYKALRASLTGAVRGLTGECVWKDVLDVVTKNLDALEADAIKASFASDILGNHFVEIIKNLMDEAILGYYNAGRSPELNLQLIIDNETNPENITIRLIDSGRGFPDELLENLRTSNNRSKFLQKKLGFFEHAFNSNASLDNMSLPESEKSSCVALPALFGGHGLGLRRFISDVDGNNNQQAGARRERYEASEHASVEFSNQLNNRGEVDGAIITLVTSIAPQAHAKKQCLRKTSPLSVVAIPDDEGSGNKVVTCCSCFAYN